VNPAPTVTTEPAGHPSAGQQKSAKTILLISADLLNPSQANPSSTHRHPAARRTAASNPPGTDKSRSTMATPIRAPRDTLTIAEICDDLGVSRRTFYEWRAKRKAPRCISLPNGSLRVRRAEYQRWLEGREEAA
jgi:predicted DNA-binding transcriptional regulator AlpA